MQFGTALEYGIVFPTYEAEDVGWPGEVLPLRDGVRLPLLQLTDAPTSPHLYAARPPNTRRTPLLLRPQRIRSFATTTSSSQRSTLSSEYEQCVAGLLKQSGRSDNAFSSSRVRRR